MDEFSNIGQIPQFEKLIATIRSREISASIILQSQSQLKAGYKDNADTIAGNCDTTLFLGGKEKSTLKDMSELLGKETIDSYNTSESKGQSPSHGMNYQKLGKDLLSQDEIAVMDGGKCICQIRGVRPFLSAKYDITKRATRSQTNTTLQKQILWAYSPCSAKNGGLLHKAEATTNILKMIGSDYSSFKKSGMTG